MKDKLTERQSIELTVRLADLGKRILGMVGTRSLLVAKLTTQDTAEQLVQLSQKLKEWEVER